MVQSIPFPRVPCAALAENLTHKRPHTPHLCMQNLSPRLILLCESFLARGPTNVGGRTHCCAVITSGAGMRSPRCALLIFVSIFEFPSTTTSSHDPSHHSHTDAIRGHLFDGRGCHQTPSTVLLNTPSPCILNTRRRGFLRVPHQCLPPASPAGVTYRNSVGSTISPTPGAQENLWHISLRAAHRAPSPRAACSRR